MMDTKEKYPDVEAAQASFKADPDLAYLESIATHDAVFGEITTEGPNYRNVGWIGSAALMMKTQIGLGVLSIPLVFNSLGLIPGLICLWTIAVITTWSDWMIGVFKMKHPEIYGLDDIGRLIFGRVGFVFMGAAFYLYWVFVSGSAMLSISIGLNALSSHATCTAVFVAVAFVAGFVLSCIRTLAQISWLAWIGLTGILASIITLTIAVGVENRPAAAPQTGPWQSDYKITKAPDFTDAITAISSLVFAYSGTPGFFSIASEMREPRMYTRSLFICQTVVTIVYSVIGIVVYYFCGSYVASPALGSANETMKKVCYGLALPGLLVTMTIVIHIPAKYVFVRILGGTKHLTSNSFIHWATWIGCAFGTSLIAYIIASAIPNFGGLVSLIGALLGTLMSFQPMGFMWLYDNWRRPKEQRGISWKLMVTWSVFVIVSGTFLMVAGTYGSVVSIIDTYSMSGSSSAWSCADNSNSAGSG